VGRWCGEMVWGDGEAGVIWFMVMVRVRVRVRV